MGTCFEQLTYRRTVKNKIKLNIDIELKRTETLYCLKEWRCRRRVKPFAFQINLDIGIKWPNDIYAKSTKIGGIIVNSQMEANVVICNIGIGLNLSNSSPTLCINDLINEYNIKNGTTLPNLTLEKVLALIFNEIERLINIVQAGDGQCLLDLYYKHWLHSSVKVRIIDTNGADQMATIVGIDEFGFLVVEKSDGIVTVHPDGNSFDMIQGLIIPKKN